MRSTAKSWSLPVFGTCSYPHTAKEVDALAPIHALVPKKACVCAPWRCLGFSSNSNYLKRHLYTQCQGNGSMM